MWTIKVKYDADSNDVGTVTASWTEGEELFTYPARCKANVDAFIANAITARNTWQTKEAANESGAAFVLNKINAADPQAGV